MLSLATSGGSGTQDRLILRARATARAGEAMASCSSDHPVPTRNDLRATHIHHNKNNKRNSHA
jgi:hypothetical protein